MTLKIKADLEGFLADLWRLARLRRTGRHLGYESVVVLGSTIDCVVETITRMTVGRSKSVTKEMGVSKLWLLG